MEVNDIAELQNVKIKIAQTEVAIEQAFLLLEKKQKIDFRKCSDYGMRGFNLSMYFDQINIQALNEENINKIQLLLIEYEKLRKLQNNAEEKVDIGKRLIEQNMSGGPE